MQETNRIGGRRGARLLVFVLPLLVLLGVLWVQRRLAAPPPPPQNDSLAGLIERLGGEEEDAAEVQAELERRVGVNDTAFWQRLLDSPRSRARYFAADTISKQETLESTRILATLLQDSASEVRLVALQALGTQDNAGKGVVHRGALIHQGRAPGSRGQPGVTSRTLSGQPDRPADPGGQPRRGALIHQGQAGPQSQELSGRDGALIHAGQPAPQGRDGALIRRDSLDGALIHEIALHTILAALHDDDTWVRERAASLLGSFIDPRAVPDLVAMLHDADRSAAVLVTAALSKQTGQKMKGSYRATDAQFQTVVRRWEAWWQTARPHWRADASTTNVAPIHPTRRFPAPDFDVTDILGHRITLSDLRGKVVLVDFLSITTGACLIEVPSLQRLQQQYGAQGLQVLGLECNGADRNTMRHFADRQGATFALAQCPVSLEKAYGDIHDVPVTFLIDREGRIRYEWAGDREGEVFEAAVRRVLADR